MKLCFVSSGGGHLYQLYSLKKLYCLYDHFWITFNTVDITTLLKRERIYFANYPESRNAINAIKNFFLGKKILEKERPDIVISCGAGIAPPVFLAAKQLNIHTLYIEPFRKTGILSRR
jgi:UDP-N-acetylglucosamine:LPS N-acetylglucosamine transferase